MESIFDIVGKGCAFDLFQKSSLKNMTIFKKGVISLFFLSSVASQTAFLNKATSMTYIIQNGGALGFRNLSIKTDLSVAGPTVAQLEVFFSSDYL